MGVKTSRYKTRISVVNTKPALSKTEIGELIFLRSDNKIYIRLVEGWKSTAALT